MDIELLRSRRTDLEEIVQVLNPDQLDLELTIYDKIVDSIEMRSKRVLDEAQRAGPEYRTQLKEYNDVLEDALLNPDTLKRLLETPDKATIREILQDAQRVAIEAGGEQRYIQRRASNIHRHADRFGHKPAYIIILNYDPAKHKNSIREGTGNFTNGPIQQLARTRQRTIIGSNIERLVEGKLSEFYGVSFEDGAMLLDNEGNIAATNAEIEIGETDHDLGDHKSLNEKYGLSAGGNTRQHAALLGSGKMAGTVIYTLGEETPNIRRYYGGKLSGSTDETELEYARSSFGL